MAKPLPTHDAEGRPYAGYSVEVSIRGRIRRLQCWATSAENAIEQAKKRYHYARHFRCLTSDPKAPTALA